jgi:hypothetical protein
VGGHVRLSLRRADETGRPELGVNEKRDVVGAQRTSEASTYARGYLLEIACAVGVGCKQVEQPGQLDDLAVRSSDEVWRVLEPGILILADQLEVRDATGALERTLAGAAPRVTARPQCG